MSPGLILFYKQTRGSSTWPPIPQSAMCTNELDAAKGADSELDAFSSRGDQISWNWLSSARPCAPSACPQAANDRCAAYFLPTPV